MKQINIRTPKELKQFRKTHRLSQSDLAEIMGMKRSSYTMITQYENRSILPLTQRPRELPDWRMWERLDKYEEKNK